MQIPHPAPHTDAINFVCASFQATDRAALSSGSKSSSSGQRYSMEQVEAFLNQEHGITMSENPADEGGGVRLAIDVAVFEAVCPMKLEAFKRRLRDFHFRKVFI